MAETASSSARALLKERDYVLFWLSRWAGATGVQVESTAIGWQIYTLARLHQDVRHSAFLVGMVGLAAFAPLFLLALPAGETADRHSRKMILLSCYAAEAAGKSHYKGAGSTVSNQRRAGGA